MEKANKNGQKDNLPQVRAETTSFSFCMHCFTNWATTAAILPSTFLGICVLPVLDTTLRVLANTTDGHDSESRTCFQS